MVQKQIGCRGIALALFKIMRASSKKKKKTSLYLGIAFLAGGLLMLFGQSKVAPQVQPETQAVVTPISIDESLSHKKIGSSVEGRAIEAYTFGTGTTRLLFVGGMHGGYEWNSVVLAYRLIASLKDHPEIIPANLTVTIIPSANPDGVYEIIGREGDFLPSDVPHTTKPEGYGRLNAHGVDLNRNFDCNWESKSMWRGETVGAGTKAFSEPETTSLRDYVLANKPTAVIFWHSQANAVYASQCNSGILPETLSLMNTYAKASGYTPIKSFDAYKVTGDAEGWLASIKIPAITVELETHQTIEWERNLAGVIALFDFYKS